MRRFAMTLFVAIGPLGCTGAGPSDVLDREREALRLLDQVELGGYGVLSTDEIRDLIETQSDMVLVDVRPEADYRAGHLLGGQSFPLPAALRYADPEQTAEPESDRDAETGEATTATEADRPEGSPREEAIAAFGRLLGEQTDRRVVFYCGGLGSRESHLGAYAAVELGYTSVFRYPGGLESWIAADLPVRTRP